MGVLLELPSFHFPVLVEFRIIYKALWVMNYFLLNRQNITSLLLLCHYFNGKCSEKLHSFIPPVQDLTCHIHWNKSSSFLSKMEVSFKQHFPKNYQWNRLLRRYFLNHYNLNLFKSRINHYLWALHIFGTCTSYLLCLYNNLNQ